MERNDLYRLVILGLFVGIAIRGPGNTFGVWDVPIFILASISLILFVVLDVLELVIRAWKRRQIRRP